MRNNKILEFIIGLILLFSINCAEYSLADILDAATRVREYIEKYNDLPKIVRVVSDEVSMVKFTYAMGVAIKNIYEKKTSSKISLINLEVPYTPHPCDIKVDLVDYIDAINRVTNYCKEKGAAPAYVTSSSSLIGYKEYVYGFSKILDFYRKNNNQLPLYCVFDSKVFNGETPPGDVKPETSKGQAIKNVEFIRGINEKNKESNIQTYKTSINSKITITPAIKKQANNLTKGLTTVLQKATAIFNYVKNNISYSGYNNSLKGAAQTLAVRAGNCCDQTNLLVALCRASGIPIKYAHGKNTYFYSSGKTYDGHVWGQILIGDIWYAADTTGRQNSLGFIKNWNIHKFGTLNQYVLIPF
jgi:hypothetical protein